MKLKKTVPLACFFTEVEMFNNLYLRQEPVEETVPLLQAEPPGREPKPRTLGALVIAAIAVKVFRNCRNR